MIRLLLILLALTATACASVPQNIRFRVAPLTEVLRLADAPGPHDVRIRLQGPPLPGSTDWWLSGDSFSIYNDGIVDITRGGQDRRYQALGLVPKADREYFGRLYRVYRLTACRERPAPSWWRLRPAAPYPPICGAPV